MLCEKNRFVRTKHHLIPHYRQNSSDNQREDHEDAVISIVRAALVDDDANVRTAAAQAFDILQEELGAKAIDQTIPTLLEALRQPGKGSGTALQALKEVMSVRVQYCDSRECND
jgi:alkaline phosphatase